MRAALLPAQQQQPRMRAHRPSSAAALRPAAIAWPAQPQQPHASSRQRRSTLAAAADSSNSPQMQPSASSNGEPAPAAPPPTSLDIAFESTQQRAASASKTASGQPQAGAMKTTGLRRAPLTGGVKTATQRYHLPTPPVAVRNLVEQAQFAHLCTVMSHMHHR